MTKGREGLFTTKFVGNFSTRLKRALKSVTFATVFSSSILLATVPPAEAAGLNINKIYHVYINNDYVGIVTDKAIVDSIVEKKISKMQEEYGDYSYILENDITYIEEQSFRNINNDSELINNLEDQIVIQAEAFAIDVDGEQVAFLQSEEEAEEVLKELKLKQVTKKELKYVESKEGKEKELKPLKKGETRVVDVQLSTDVTVTDKVETDPEQVLTVKEAVKLLEKGALEEKQYKVKKGDVLGTIAEKHNLKTKQLIELNDGITEETVLQIGQKLNVTEYKPYVEVIVTKEMYDKEKLDFEKEVVEDKSMFKGEKKVTQKGKKGLREVTYTVTEKNGKTVKKEVASEKVLRKPVKEITVKGTKVVPSRGSGSLSWPTNGGYVSSKQGYRWGSFHKGIDIARPSNLTIKAADNGVVVSAGWDSSGYGNKIVIDHNNGYRTIYAHLSSIGVKSGQTVSKGSSIGIMGSTGNSTGVHLHFEVYKNGSLENPLKYIR